MSLPPWLAEVVAIRDLSQDVREMALKPVEGSVSFAPGQWIALHLPLPEKPTVRAYTMALPPSPDEGLVLCFDHVKGGAASSYLFSIRPGHRLDVTGPQGTFVLPAPMPEGLLMVSWRTGIVPFRCMLRHLVEAGTLPTTLLVAGAPTPDELPYLGELEELARSHPSFHFRTVVEAGSDKAGAVSGALAAAVGEIWPGRDVPGRAHAMVAGIRAVVYPVRQWLIDRAGYRREQVQKETYD